MARPGGAPSASLLSDRGGAVYAEYVIVTLLVGIGVSAAIIGVGVPLLESFRMTQAFLGASIP
ncbi:MAG: hypothetical protein OEY14_02480 [Myxococcales bacterium]|nr:hypothetical protein [Myxococcales bacterium]